MMLKAAHNMGAVQGKDWSPFVVKDGKLITGQNPQVSTSKALTCSSISLPMHVLLPTILGDN